MYIQTKYFSELEVTDSDLLVFAHGLPGFEDYHQFVLLPIDDTGTYFVLQSVEEADVALIVTNPYLFYKNYSFDFDEKSMGIKGLEEVAVYSVVTLEDPFEKSTLNLQAPIVINVRTKEGKQIILNDSVYRTKHELLQEIKGGGNHARS
ncbi:flagellar assembly protein FliW [Halobacillus sp. ACCC02827]|uniref:flagellar assembly protein FliW n=1 Tax=Bacillaceae TaxID=186817 RepID=UPI0002A50200|nr:MULTISPECIES: flagellar assembly protein FliW [Bacillaceae]ELK47063.1 flagellar assembly protein FliW [Halobacillus sp. BAB-2008]QHT47676.1 flagellar assembly protein FliW [Bacillus sp. SB49]WJE14916.1 flagellar assembly protein FliW [Halobacillus sp. ACCC02827]